MCDAQEPDRVNRVSDDAALEEIRRLFARYRRIARHGQVTEREEAREERAEDDRVPVASR